MHWPQNAVQAARSRVSHSPRICVIFNPTARGEKAKRFRRHLDSIGADCALKPTTAPGAARTLAAEAAREDFEVIVAAGGDGTVNEVLNGIAEDPENLLRVRLGVLPLGTINVFARELGLSLDWRRAWGTIRRGRVAAIDLPLVEFTANGEPQRRYFAQLAGDRRTQKDYSQQYLTERAGGDFKLARGLTTALLRFYSWESQDFSGKLVFCNQFPENRSSSEMEGFTADQSWFFPMPNFQTACSTFACSRA